MNDKKIIIGFIIVTVLLLGGGIFFLAKTTITSPITASQNVKAEVTEKNYDWGNIPYGRGNVSKTFTIKNSGTDILKLINVKTSCTCTKAQVVINGSSSPYFSMHNTSSWVGEVPVGGEAKLTVIFDPAFHGPTGVGPMTRLISVETNDAQNKTIEFNLSGTVVKD